MEDQSIFTKSQPKEISEGLQSFIDSMVEEIVLEGKPFDTQKKYLKKFSEKEGLDYDKLETDINSFIEVLDSLKAAFSNLQVKLAEEKGRECHISEPVVKKLIHHSSHSQPIKMKRKVERIIARLKKTRYSWYATLGLGGLALLGLMTFFITQRCTSSSHVTVLTDTVIVRDSIVVMDTIKIKSSATQTSKGLEAVDLGLPSGTRWANMNVGATSPEDYGDYFAWGEIEEKSDYSKETYVHYDRSLKKHCFLGSNISGTKYDVAHEKWGGSWQIPTFDQMQELRKECKYELAYVKSVKGYRFTGPNGHSIFLPAAGYMEKDKFDKDGEYGVYWSGHPNLPHSTGYYSALCLCFHDHKLNLSYWWRENGHSVRPVIKEINDMDEKDKAAQIIDKAATNVKKSLGL